MMSTPAPRRRWLIAALALLATACTGGDDETATTTASTAAPTTTEASTTTTEAATTTTSSTSSTSSTLPRVEVIEATARAGDLQLHVESDQAFIWATTDRDDVCSPAEPAVAVFTAELDGVEPVDVLGVRAFFEPIDPASTSTTSTTTTTTITTTATTEPTDERSGQRSLDFAVDDEGVWRAIVGPVEATNRRDRAMAVTVVARTVDGDEVETDLELTVRAPERCDGTNDSGRRRSLPGPVTLTVTTDPADGVVVGKEVADCFDRPTQVGIRVQASGAVVAMTATGTLPDGSTVSRSMQARGDRDFTVQLGPFRSPPAGEQVAVTFTVTATDVYGTTALKTVSVTLVRPCVDPGGTVPDDTTPDDTLPDDAPGDPQFAVTASPNPLEVWATGSGFCPGGATTFTIAATAPQRASSVVVTARTVNGQQIERALGYSNGAWRGTLGPFDGWAGMPDRSTLGVQIRATVDGQTRTLQQEGRLRRPSACDPGVTTTQAPSTTTTTQPATVTTTTQAPTTTTAPTTTAAPTTTTTQPPAPPTITNAAANPNPATCGQSVTIGAQTTGVVDQVGAQLGGLQIALNRSGSNWRVDTTAPANPGDYEIRIIARNATTGKTDTTRITVRVTC